MGFENCSDATWQISKRWFGCHLKNKLEEQADWVRGVGWVPGCGAELKVRSGPTLQACWMCVDKRTSLRGLAQSSWKDGVSILICFLWLL